MRISTGAEIARFHPCGIRLPSSLPTLSAGIPVYRDGLETDTKLDLIGHHLAVSFPPYLRCRLSTFTHRRYSAKRKRRQRRANPRDSSAGWSRLPLAVARLLFTHRRCSAKRKQRQRRPRISPFAVPLIGGTALCRHSCFPAGFVKTPPVSLLRDSARFRVLTSA